MHELRHSFVAEAGLRICGLGGAPTYWTAAGWAYRRHTCGSLQLEFSHYFILK